MKSQDETDTNETSDERSSDRCLKFPTTTTPSNSHSTHPYHCSTSITAPPQADRTTEQANSPQALLECDSPLLGYFWDYGGNEREIGDERICEEEAFTSKQIPRMYVSSEQYEYVKEKVDECSENRKLFFKWVLAATMNQSFTRCRWIAIPAINIRKEIDWTIINTENFWKPLRGKGLLEVINDYRFFPDSEKLGWCRKFKIPHGIFSQILEKQCMGTRYDLYTGKRKLSKAHKTLIKKKPEDDSDHRRRRPQLIEDALRVFKNGRSLFNVQAARKHLRELKKKYNRLKHSDPDRATEVKNKYENDVNCLQAVVNQRPEKVVGMEGEIYEYPVGYKVQKKSGRLSEVGGGLQNCSCELKKAARSGITGLENYDIKSSQLTLLRQRLKDAGYDVSGLRHFFSHDKEEIAERIGISRGTFKGAMYAVLYHGRLWYSWEDALDNLSEGNLTAIPRLIFDERPSEANVVYNKLADVLMPLREAREQLAEYRLNEFFEAEKDRDGTISNQCGVKFKPDDVEHKREQKIRAMVHCLQGDEAALIHHLTVLSKEEFEGNYEVLANEHDGIITIGKIPQEATDIAKQRSNFTSAELVPKPFM